MKYQVVFKERVDGSGEPTDRAHEVLEDAVVDGVILDSVFVDRVEPDMLHSSEIAEEDDSFLSVTTEVWEYDVADGREQEFLEAVRGSGVAMEVTELNEMMDTGTINTAD